MPKYLRVDLLEPISDMIVMDQEDADNAVTELRDYLMNEFDNQGIQAVLTIVEEPAQ